MASLRLSSSARQLAWPSFGHPHLRTPVRAPRANAIAERWIATARRKRLDHLLITKPRHLAAVLQEYISTTTPTAHTDRLISIRPQAALPRPPTRSSGPYDEIGSAASYTSICTSLDVTGFSARTASQLQRQSDLRARVSNEADQRQRAVNRVSSLRGRPARAIRV